MEVERSSNIMQKSNNYRIVDEQYLYMLQLQVARSKTY